MTQASDFTQYRAVDSIGYLLRRANKLAMPLADNAFVGEELTFIQWIALVQLRDGLADTSGGLARCLDHNSGAMTRIVDQLVERGLVARQRSEADRRVVHLVLTDAGRTSVERLIPRIFSLWQTILGEFDADEIALFTVLIKRLVRRLDAETVARGLA